MKFRLSLYEGNWQRLSREAIEAVLDSFDYEFVEPDEDVAVAIEITVTCPDAEIVRDEIIERILQLEPEYESMVEVEVSDAR